MYIRNTMFYNPLPVWSDSVYSAVIINLKHEQREHNGSTIEDDIFYASLLDKIDIFSLQFHWNLFLWVDKPALILASPDHNKLIHFFCGMPITPTS